MTIDDFTVHVNRGRIAAPSKWPIYHDIANALRKTGYVIDEEVLHAHYQLFGSGGIEADEFAFPLTDPDEDISIRRQQR